MFLTMLLYRSLVVFVAVLTLGTATTWKRAYKSQCISGQTPPHSSCLPDSDKTAKGFETTKDEREEILARHRFWRKQVQPAAADMLDLKWDKELEISATRWAAQCEGEHDEDDNRRTERFDWVGQGICIAGWNENWGSCINDWASERKYWKYGVGPTADKEIGHWTQIIWSETRFVGCGKARCRRTPWMYQLVCNYAPGGNIEKEGAFNVWSHPYKAL